MNSKKIEAPPVPILSNISRRLKKHFFLDMISKGDAVLEIGCGDGWVARYMSRRGVTNFVDIDTTPAANIIGDIRNWRALGMQPESYDVIIAFEVLEHVDCMDDCYALLKPNGKLMVTSPYPPADSFLKKLEEWRLNQPRTSPHDHLTYFKESAQFAIDRFWRPLFMSQWYVFCRK